MAFGLIIPFFNGTIGMLRRGGHAPVSVFWDRYAWLGQNPVVGIRNVVFEPGLWIHWFAQGDVQAYLATLLLSGGLVAVLAPDVLLVTVPIVFQDTLSAFPWMRSGGAHCSVMIIPVLIFAGGLRSECLARDDGEN